MSRMVNFKVIILRLEYLKKNIYINLNKQKQQQQKNKEKKFKQKKLTSAIYYFIIKQKPFQYILSSF